MTIINEENYHQDVPGVTLKIFRDGINELSLENKELVKKIFKKANTSHSGYLCWEEFLESMKIIFTDSLEVKIELFFDIIDR